MNQPKPIFNSSARQSVQAGSADSSPAAEPNQSQSNQFQVVAPQAGQLQGKSQQAGHAESGQSIAVSSQINSTEKSINSSALKTVPNSGRICVLRRGPRSSIGKAVSSCKTNKAQSVFNGKQAIGDVPESGK